MLLWFLGFTLYGEKKTSRISGSGDVSIQQCWFEGCSGTVGGAVCMTGCTSCTIGNNVFLLCHSTANQGGALHASASTYDVVLYGNCGSLCHTTGTYSGNMMKASSNKGLYVNYTTAIYCSNNTLAGDDPLMLFGAPACLRNINISQNTVAAHNGVCFHYLAKCRVNQAYTTAQSNCGGVYILTVNEGVTADRFVYCSFVNNSARDGFSQYYSLPMYHCYFDANTHEPELAFKMEEAYVDCEFLNTAFCNQMTLEFTNHYSQLQMLPLVFFSVQLSA